MGLLIGGLLLLGAAKAVEQIEGAATLNKMRKQALDGVNRLAKLNEADYARRAKEREEKEKNNDCRL